MGLSIGLDTAVKALRAHQLAVDVASHNIANANTPGFSRQRVLLRPIGVDGSDHFSRDALLGRVGFGVDASDVNRVRNVFLDFQQRSALGSKSQYTAMANELAKTEIIFNDPSDDGMSALLGQFWNAWHDVVNDPELSAGRTTLVHSTTTLTTRIQGAYNNLVDQRKELNFEVAVIADEINAKASEIASLNFQIKQVELSGDMANDLRDRRDLLLDELSGIAQISYAEQPDRSVAVYMGNHELVVQNSIREVAVVGDALNPGMNKLVFAGDNADVQTTTGRLRGILDVRDNDLPKLIQKMNDFASQLITSVNALHTTGYGLDNATGNAFFTGTDASNIAINAVLTANPERIAVSSAMNAPGDASIGLQIADLAQAMTMSGGTETFADYYGSLVTNLGADINRAKGLQSSGELLSNHLEAMRQSTQGVNIDEEVTQLNSAQHAYQAAARVITTIDEMLDTLINRTGLAGR
ncbi:MAG: flagellar hook-associated protein FlgK [Dehalococcoidia bacterium]|nr:flagellar hook-associated protein FlgK [Dehalococcoidia bacterium]